MTTDSGCSLETIETYMSGLHAGLVSAIEKTDGGRFLRDPWTWREGGGGVTCVLEEGRVFERACVGFSRVRASRLPAAANARRAEIAGRPFEVIGVSVIAHPRNPYAPTGHMNVRFFTTREGPGPEAWWFGACMDLTPHYGFAEDAQHFHATCRDALAPFGRELYRLFKKHCDEYFHLRHRGEARGIGGIFCDDLNTPSLDECFAVARSIGDHFIPAYIPIVEKRAAAPYGQRERDFQALRRGRYIEFNLAQDRGTAFGLQLGGRAESILASLPPNARWRYDWRPEPGSPEEKLSTNFLVPKEWI